MDRRIQLSRASEAIHKVIIGDCEHGFIDEDTRTILREAFYHVLMAIDSHNNVWHIEDYGSSYPDNESADNDWTMWDIQIAAPIHLGYLAGQVDRDYFF